MRRKSGLFGFLCTLFPGAAEMNQGYMKMGSSLMGIFLLCLTAYAEVSRTLFLAGVLVWFYGFFHGRNLNAEINAGRTDITDQYIWNEFQKDRTIAFEGRAGKKIVGGLLILFGCLSAWHIFTDTFISRIVEYIFGIDRCWEIMGIFRAVPQIVFAVLVILLGIRMIKGKKSELEKQAQETPVMPEIFEKEEKNNPEKADSEKSDSEVIGKEETEEMEKEAEDGAEK